MGGRTPKPVTPGTPDASPGTVRGGKKKKTSDKAAANAAAEKSKDLQQRLKQINIAAQIPGINLKTPVAELIAKHGDAGVEALRSQGLERLLPGPEVMGTVEGPTTSATTPVDSSDSLPPVPTNAPPATNTAAPVAAGTTTAEQVAELEAAGYDRRTIQAMTPADRLGALAMVEREKLEALKAEMAAGYSGEGKPAEVAAVANDQSVAETPVATPAQSVVIAPEDIAALKAFGFEDAEIAALSPEKIAETAASIREQSGEPTTSSRVEETMADSTSPQNNPVSANADNLTSAASAASATPQNTPVSESSGVVTNQVNPTASMGPDDPAQMVRTLMAAGYTIQDIQGFDADTLGRAYRYAAQGNMRPGSKYRNPLEALLGDEYAPRLNQPSPLAALTDSAEAPAPAPVDSPQAIPAESEFVPPGVVARQASPRPQPQINPLGGLITRLNEEGVVPDMSGQTPSVIVREAEYPPAVPRPQAMAAPDPPKMTLDPRSAQVRLGTYNPDPVVTQGEGFASAFPEAGQRTPRQDGGNTGGGDGGGTTGGGDGPPKNPWTWKGYGAAALGTAMGVQGLRWLLSEDNDGTDYWNQKSRENLMQDVDLRKGLGNWGQQQTTP